MLICVLTVSEHAKICSNRKCSKVVRRSSTFLAMFRSLRKIFGNLRTFLEIPVMTRKSQAFDSEKVSRCNIGIEKNAKYK